VDYARGLVDAEERAAMDQHLREGCVRCAAQSRLFSRVAELASADDDYEPPEYARHAARAVFALHRPDIVQTPLLPLRLVYDSFRDLAPMGVRSGQPMTRHVLYEAGPYAVDLKLDHERGARTLLLTGQVANAQEPEAVRGIPILLLDGKTVVVSGSSNPSGEFQMEYEPRPGLRLLVDIGGTHQIELPLSE
jgi:hypothetical protein